MLKRMTFLIAVIVIFVAVNTGHIKKLSQSTEINFADVGGEYSWAKEAISYLSSRGIVSGVGKTSIFLMRLLRKNRLQL